MNTQDPNFLPVVQQDPKEGLSPLWLSCPMSILALSALRRLESMSSMGNWRKRISNLEKIKLCLHLWLFWTILVKRLKQGRKISNPNCMTFLLIQKDTVLHYSSEKQNKTNKTQNEHYQEFVSSMTPVISNIRTQHQSFRYTFMKESWQTLHLRKP